MIPREHKVYADCFETISNAVEMYDILNNEPKLNVFKQVAKENEFVDEVRGINIDAPNWLPFAAEKYNISANVKDYIISPIVIMPSDIPNKNGIGFPHTELTSFNTDAGTLMYNTWKGKPTHVEHKNNDISKAKGVILSSAYRRLKGYKGNLWKVLCLAAFDRSKDSILCNKILNNDNNKFSMGAYCSDYRCSITGELYSSGKAEQYTKLKKPTFAIVDDKKLAFLSVVEATGFEVSYVENPAFISAVSEEKLIL